jgi:hypothetical protein
MATSITVAWRSIREERFDISLGPNVNRGGEKDETDGRLRQSTPRCTKGARGTCVAAREEEERAWAAEESGGEGGPGKEAELTMNLYGFRTKPPK